MRITQTDLEAALNDDFFRRGAVCFDEVWSQTESEAQRYLLHHMARRNAPWTWKELSAACGLGPSTLEAALRWAERHDVVQKVAGEPPQWQFYVPLMRRWLQIHTAPR